MSQEPIPIRTRTRQYEFNPTDGTITVYAVTPDAAGLTLVRGRALVKMSIEEVRERPDLERVLFECTRLWFPHWFVPGVR